MPYGARSYAAISQEKIVVTLYLPLEEKATSKQLLSYKYSPVYQRKKGKKPPILVIAGPTGVGKSVIAIEVAKNIGGEIISADSMQLYKGMDIGTAKIGKKEQQNIPHYMMDVRPISDECNVVAYYHEAHRVCKDIVARGKVPIVVGGSGFYLHAFIYGPPSGPPSHPEFREKLEKQMEKMGAEVLYEHLQMLDPVYAATITERDRHKIIRALEIIQITKKPVSFFSKKNEFPDPAYNFRCWFFMREKKELLDRVEKKCEEMIEKGLLDEVRKLRANGLEENSSAANAIGYRQVIKFLKSNQGEIDYLEFKRSFIQASKRYIKRQITWFKKEPLFRWIMVDQNIIHTIIQDLEVQF